MASSLIEVFMFSIVRFPSRIYAYGAVVKNHAGTTGDLSSSVNVIQKNHALFHNHWFAYQYNYLSVIAIYPY